jgi:hypothetical protein
VVHSEAHTTVGPLVKTQSCPVARRMSLPAALIGDLTSYWEAGLNRRRPVLRARSRPALNVLTSNRFGHRRGR